MKDKITDFIKDIEEVCNAHGLSISHEDTQSAFIIHVFDQDDIVSLLCAITTEAELSRKAG